MVEHFKDLSKKELSKFLKFANSPFHNSNKNLIKLVSYLKSVYPDVKDESLDKKKIYSEVFTGARFNETNIRKLFSDFTNLYEKFLLYSELEKEKPRNQITLLRILRTKGFAKRYNQIFKEISKLQKKTFSKDQDFYNNQANLENEIYYFNLNRFRNEYADCLVRKSANIDFQFIFSKLHCFHEMLNNEINNSNIHSYNKPFYDEILNFIESDIVQFSKNDPNIYIIYLVIKMLTESDDKYLNELLKYLEANKKKFLKSNLSYYYYYLINFHLTKINKGEVNYHSGAFKIYKIMFENKLFLIDNIITDYEFNSVINTALYLKEYRWLKNFIEKYRKFLDPAFAKESYNLALAKLYFHKKEYEKVIPFLNEVYYKDALYYLNSKFILARLNYDMKNFESLPFTIENLKQYIREKSNLNEERKLMGKTFIKHISSLMKLAEMNNKNRKIELIVFRKQLDNDKNVVSNKTWFYEKIEELNI